MGSCCSCDTRSNGDLDDKANPEKKYLKEEQLSPLELALIIKLQAAVKGAVQREMELKKAMPSGNYDKLKVPTNANLNASNSTMNETYNTINSLNRTKTSLSSFDRSPMRSNSSFHRSGTICSKLHIRNWEEQYK